MARLNIMIVDDHPMIREGLATMLGGCRDINIVGSCADGVEAGRLAGTLSPEIILMDIKMGSSNGIDAAAEIKKEYPEIKIIFLTVFEDTEFMRLALQAGASGYILKNVSQDRLIDYIFRVHQGETIIDPGVFNNIVSDYIKLSRLAGPDGEPKAQAVQFTPREREILSHLTKGMTNKEISAITHLSVDTIKTHLRNIFRKFNVKNRSQAVNQGIKYFNSLQHGEARRP